MNNINTKYQPVIGLEVHVQLATKSKVFCACRTDFGQPPNSSTCPVCLGFPGALPVLNREAFRYALKVALALNCDVQPFVKFDRKNYYYPDLPKNYQISQYDKPFAFNGCVELEAGGNKKVSIRRVHLEEDAGKLLHDQDKSSSAVDFNRAGMPLLEIVTEPDINSPENAYEYLTNLKAILLYLGVSDCNMEEGSLRCDANISVREAGETRLGVKSELKNMNSFKAVRTALEYEIERHIDLLAKGKEIVQETRLWDAATEITVAMRTKEETHDYRYFPEPDLVPFYISESDIRQVKTELPEMPRERKKRFMEQYKLGEKETGILIADKNIADFFEETVKYRNTPKVIANWVTGDIMSELNQKAVSITGFGFAPSMLAELITLIDEGTISGKMAKDLIRECAERKISPADIVEEKGLKQISDESELAKIARKVIDDNTRSVRDYKKGKTNALMFLVGQVMRHTEGKANPGVVNRILRKLLDSMVDS